MAGSSMIDFYTAATPNGYKIAIYLEEAGIEYRPHFLSLSDNDQKTPEFLAINPNGRIPAIVDRDAGDFAVFESGAILLYLAEKTGKFWPADPKERSVQTQWLMWQMGGLGPMMGQLNVFKRYFPEKLPAAIERYERESYRLFGVLEKHLGEDGYIGADYGIADMACFPWVAAYKWPELSLEDYPKLKAWHDRIRARPAVERAMQVPPRADVSSKEGTDKFVKGARSMLA
ncbi:glutathione S-transferase family protein [Novosphingopyxis iocasae]|uniref:glutathione S-transferase family protein n=1 Tax=Novosphingopyxis iocasae TaxID=2762729 RepID=UPI001FED0C2C|nr:glutathione S-transferase N-terminal domain-containing protein [Novosphingopyxis iocasae]